MINLQTARTMGIEIAQDDGTYNYQRGKHWPISELPGISVFYKDFKGTVFHTYSTYARGLDMLNVAYHYLDLVPKGRDEGDGNGTAWIRRHDEYDLATTVAGS